MSIQKSKEVLLDSLQGFLRTESFLSADAGVPISVYGAGQDRTFEHLSIREGYGHGVSPEGITERVRADEFYLTHGSGFDPRILIITLCKLQQYSDITITDYRQVTPDFWLRVGEFFDIPLDEPREYAGFYLNPLSSVEGVDDISMGLCLHNPSVHTPSNIESFRAVFAVSLAGEPAVNPGQTYPNLPRRYFLTLPKSAVFTREELVRATVFHEGSVKPLYEDKGLARVVRRARAWMEVWPDVEIASIHDE